jgi:hypothetical protein
MPDVPPPEVLVAFGRAVRHLRVERGPRKVSLVNIDRLARALSVETGPL